MQGLYGIKLNGLNNPFLQINKSIESKSYKWRDGKVIEFENFPVNWFPYINLIERGKWFCETILKSRMKLSMKFYRSIRFTKFRNSVGRVPESWFE